MLLHEFWILPALLAGSGNYAVLEQLCALSWVQRHIASFGGDARNVTIWGLSSGAQYVSTLLVSPAGQNLFHRAVVHVPSWGGMRREPGLRTRQT